MRAAFAYNVASERLFNAWAVRNEIPDGELTPDTKEAITAKVNGILDRRAALAS